ncbi:MAG: ATP-binding protein [Bdellovibrio sp.]
MISKKLSRQLKKTFDNADLESSIASWKIQLQTLPDSFSKDDLLGFVSSFPEFVSLVDETYSEGDEKVELVQRNLEVSSKELTEANKNLYQFNQTFDAMLNSLGQGFFMFDVTGTCLPVYSKACEELIGCKPAGKKVFDVLKIKTDEQSSFCEWYELLFQDLIEFEDLAVLGPQSLDDPKRSISIEYRAVRDRENTVNSVLVIATDRTAEVLAQRKADELQAHVTFLASALKDREQFKRYVSESRRLFEECVNIVKGEQLTPEHIRLLNLNLHTLKGAAGSFGVVRVKDDLHDIETKLKEFKTPVEIQDFLSETIIQVVNGFEKLLDDNKDIVGDTVVKSEPTRELALKDLIDIANAIKGISNMRSIYEVFIQRMVSVPAKDLFAPFDMVLQAAANKLGKSIKPLEIESDLLFLIPENYNDLLTSLVHVFRNIADHGIETPEMRKANGKNSQGQVRVELRQMPNNDHRFTILISDDGRGVDYDKIRKKLRDKGFAKEAETATHRELIEWLFQPEFSTAEKVTEFSGRGVGLDAVRRSVEIIGGKIKMESTPGFGTSFYIELPLLMDCHAESIGGAA